MYIQGYDLPATRKLAPFRTYTLPYTGQSNYEPRREPPAQKLTTYIKELAKLAAQSDMVSKYKATSITQFLRGDLFIVADYLLTKKNY